MSEDFSISEGEMDGGVECESGPCDGKNATEQQSEAFDLLVDLCSPTGRKLWIVAEKNSIAHTQEIKLDFFFLKGKVNHIS